MQVYTVQDPCVELFLLIDYNAPSNDHVLLQEIVYQTLEYLSEQSNHCWTVLMGQLHRSILQAKKEMEN